MTSAPGLQRLRAALGWLAALAFLVAAFFVWRTIRRYGLAAIGTALREMDPGAIVLASVFAASSYFTLTLSDWLALRTMCTRRVSYPFVALTAFTSIAVGHTVGFGAVSSGTIRYRMYSRVGLLEGDVVRVLFFAGATVTVGLTALCGVTSLLHPTLVARFARIPRPALLALAATALLALAMYVLWAARSRRELRLFRFRIPVPSVRIALAQIAVGAANYYLVAATLHALLGDDVGISLGTFAAYYSIGHLLAMLTHVPAGLGVMELVVLSVAPGAESVGALIVFRVVYYVVPFVLGAILYAGFEWRERRRARGERKSDPTGSAPLATEE